MRIDPLLAHYPVRIREVTLGVILGISILFYVFPRFLGEAKKVTTTIQQEIETFDIPQTEQIKLPEPPPRPSVPVASEDEFFDEDITIDDTDMENFDDWEAPQVDSNMKFEYIVINLNLIILNNIEIIFLKFKYCIFNNKSMY